MSPPYSTALPVDAHLLVLEIHQWGCNLAAVAPEEPTKAQITGVRKELKIQGSQTLGLIEKADAISVKDVSKTPSHVTVKPGVEFDLVMKLSGGVNHSPEEYLG